MEFTINQIAELLGGNVEGDGSQKVSRLDKIQEGKPGGVSFLSNQKYEPYLYTTECTAVIVATSLVPTRPVKATLIRVEDPYLGFTQLLEAAAAFAKPAHVGVEEPSFMHESSAMGIDGYRGAFSYIGKNTRIGDRVQIHHNAFIGENVTIGDDCVIHAGAKVMPRTIIGNRCEIHPGAVIGSDGFGFAPQPDGTYRNIPQLGNVVIEDNVSIGANTTIDCATMGSTRIGKGVKIDNLVQIAHNVEVGENTVIASQSGISGSAKIGKRNVLAGKSSVVGHIKLADKTTVGGNTAIMKSIEEEGQTLLGYIGMDMKDFLKSYAVFKKLPSIQNKLQDLEKKQ